MIKFFLVLAFCFIHCACYSQDSLTDKYRKYKFDNRSDSAYWLLKAAKDNVRQAKNMRSTNELLTLVRQFIQDFSPSPEQLKSGSGGFYIKRVAQVVWLKLEVLPQVLASRAGIKFDKEDYHGAMADWKEALTAFEKPDNAFEGGLYFYNIGACYWNLGQKTDACVNMSKAGELGCEEAYDFIKVHCNR